MKQRKEGKIYNKKSAEYFCDLTNYVKSQKYIYDCFEKEIYEKIKKAACEGKYYINIDIDSNNSDMINRLISILKPRGFYITKYKTWAVINWNKK